VLKSREDRCVGWGVDCWAGDQLPIQCMCHTILFRPELSPIQDVRCALSNTTSEATMGDLQEIHYRETCIAVLRGIVVSEMLLSAGRASEG